LKSTKGTTKNRWWNCVQTDTTKYNITNWKYGSKNIAEWEKSIKEEDGQWTAVPSKKKKKEKKKKKKRNEEKKKKRKEKKSKEKENSE